MGYIQCLKSLRTAAAIQNTYTTAKSVIGGLGQVILSPNQLAPGDMLHVRVSGGISNIITAQPTFTFQSVIGPPPTPSIIAHSSQAYLANTAAHVLTPFEYDLWMRLDSEGSGVLAKFLSQARLTCRAFVISGAVADPTLTDAGILGPATAPAVGTGFDSTITNVLDFFVGISVSNAANGIQVYQYTVDLHTERN